MPVDGRGNSGLTLRKAKKEATRTRVIAASRALFALLAREFVDQNAILGRHFIQLSYRPTRNRKAKTTATAGIGAVGPRASHF